MSVDQPLPKRSSVDISSVAFWSGTFDQREQRFAQLRRQEPVSWHPALETPGLPPRFLEPGFWAVTRAAEISAVSRDSGRFSSAVRQVSVRPVSYRLAPNMLVSDPPEHDLYRAVAAPIFAPGRLRDLTPQIERAARQIVLRSTFLHQFDLVADVAAKVPARVLALLLQIPPSELDSFMVATDAFASSALPADMTDPAAADSWFQEQSHYLVTLFDDLAGFRLRHPADDLVSMLVRHVGSGRLEAEVVRSSLLLLLVAGHDTMKQLIALSAFHLLRQPLERAWLEADFDARFDSAFDELVRFTSPVLSFARTATADLVLAGAPIRAGDKVALFYCSGNRDAALFDNPELLRLSRSPNRHVAFGGGGLHFCLGSVLARIELRSVLRTLLRKAEGFEAAEPVYGLNDAVHRVERISVRRT